MLVDRLLGPLMTLIAELQIALMFVAAIPQGYLRAVAIRCHNVEPCVFGLHGHADLGMLELLFSMLSCKLSTSA
jgi:hypothetical protein